MLVLFAEMMRQCSALVMHVCLWRLTHARDYKTSQLTEEFSFFNVGCIFVIFTGSSDADSNSVCFYELRFKMNLRSAPSV